MNAFRTRLDRQSWGFGRRVRFDAPDRWRETPDAAYLRGWVARQARLYDDLLSTIAHAPNPHAGSDGR